MSAPPGPARPNPVIWRSPRCIMGWHKRCRDYPPCKCKCHAHAVNVADHTQCHADINALLVELKRLRDVLAMCAEAGREAGEALVYRTESFFDPADCNDFGCHEQETVER